MIIFPDQNLQIINENESFMELWNSKEQTKTFPLFYKNDTFTVSEAACLIAGYEPSIVGYNYRKVVWLNNNPAYREAANLIYASVRAGLFEEMSPDIFIIKSAHLKNLLQEKEIFIDGFNNHSKEIELSYGQLLENNEKLSKALKHEELQSSLLVSDYHSSQHEITRLKDLINKKDAEIERLNEQVLSESFESFLYQAERDNLDFEVVELKERVKD
ncbi:hypothetical protein ACMUMS_16360 [Acinetobacter courvalinii]|uniref:hypothetical protein n=1 Tax=Acinetobacter courvalinii TaxID=280147 RepID=UPI003A888F62